MRRFDSEEERVRLYEAHYGSEHWKTTLSPRTGELIDREQIRPAGGLGIGGYFHPDELEPIPEPP